MAKEQSDEDIMGMINTAVEKQKDKIPKEVQKELKDILTSVYRDGKLLKDAFEVNDDLMECFYSCAYNLYNSGNFDQALGIFKVLTTLDPTKSKYHMGLASCYHMMKQYDTALTVYMAVAFLDKSPVPYYHAADCFMQLKKPGPAILMLNAVESRCGDDPSMAILKQRAIQIRDKLGHDLEELAKKN